MTYPSHVNQEVIVWSVEGEGETAGVDGNRNEKQKVASS